MQNVSFLIFKGLRENSVGVKILSLELDEVEQIIERNIYSPAPYSEFCVVCVIGRLMWKADGGCFTHGL